MQFNPLIVSLFSFYGHVEVPNANSVLLVLCNEVRNTAILSIRKDELFSVHDRDAIQRFNVCLGNCLPRNGAVWWKLEVYSSGGKIALIERGEESEPEGYRKKTGRGLSAWRVRKDGARIVACD